MKNRQRLGKTTVAIVVSTLAFSNCAWGLPQGGTVVTGNGSYTSSGNQMDITGTGNVSVKWDSFNVAAGETVNFKNMNAILNYVTGRQGSEIFGALNGQGVHVFLINPNGILFGKTAQVNVGSLTASTKSLSDVDTALQNFKNSAGISDFGIAGTAELVNMGKLEADTLRFEGSRIVLDTDNIKLGGDDFDGSNAVINGDFANGNVVLGYTAHDANGYAGKDKNFDINGGAQSVKGYMWVTNAEQLQDINTNLSGNYALKNDIDAGGIANFVPIGNDDVFAGSFDGLGNDIKRLTINRPADDQVGLFYETAKNSILRNFSLLDVDIRGHEATGSIVGGNVGTIENVIVTGKVAGEDAATGGVVGLNLGSIINAVTDVIVTGNDSYTGGVVGQNLSGGIIEASDIRGTVNGVKYTGGIAGYNNGIIKDGDLMVTITSNDIGIGGVVGNNGSIGIIDTITVTGSVNAYSNQVVGGIAGNNAGKIMNSTNKTSVNAGTNVGGITGQNRATGQVIDCVNNGSINGVTCAGGIVGFNRGIIQGAVNNGNLFVENPDSSYIYRGGIVGFNPDDAATKISNVTNTGKVNGYNNIGGIIGYTQSAHDITDITNTGNITGNDYIGGIVGYYSNANDMLLINSNNSGNIIGNSMVGGIVGSGGGSVIGGGGLSGCISIETAENSGNITGVSSVGGIMGGSGYTKLIDKVINYGTVTGTSQVGGILGNTSSGKIGEALNLGQVSAENSCGGIVGFGIDAIVSDKAVYATTDKDGNTYDISKYNDKGVGKAYADIFPALPLPPDPPELPEDEHDITKLPEFEENYHSSSSAVTSELHTPVIINPSVENTNIGAELLEIHDSDGGLNASGSGSSFSTGFENILGGAGQEEQADSNSRSSDTGDVQDSQSDNLAGGNETYSSPFVDSDTEDQDEQNNEEK